MLLKLNDLMKTLPPLPFFSPRSLLLNPPSNIEIHQSNKHFHALNITSYLSRAIHAAAAIQPPFPPAPNAPSFSTTRTIA